MAKVDELKTRRSSTQGSITRIKTHIEKHQLTITLPELECRLGLLEAYFKQILHDQNEIETLVTDATSEFQKRCDLEELYVAVKTKIKAIMAERRKMESPKDDDAHNQTIYMPATPSSTLSKLKLPKFSGQYTEYQNFIQQFMSRVDSNAALSTIDKFTHLEDCLIGDAKLVINSLDVVATNYAKALQMIKDRYDNKCIIVQSHIRKIFELPTVSKNSASQLRHLVDSIDGHVRALYSLGDEKDIVNALLLHLVVLKLDSESLAKWKDSLDLQKLPMWSECSTFFSKRCQHLEKRDIVQKSNYQQEQSTKRPNKGSIPNRSTSLTISKSQCSYCKQDGHTVNQCKKFLELTVMNRYNEVKKLMLCLNCLSTGRSVKQCRSSKCKVCNGPHNTLLHRFTSNSSSVHSATSSPAIKTKLIHIQDPSTSQQPVHSSLIVNESSSENRVLLATAVIDIKNNLGRYVPIRVLLDSASQLNFITQYAAQKLGLRKKKIDEIINGIGDVNSKIRHKTSTTIKSASTKFETNIDLWILPSITTPQPEAKLDVENWPIPNDLTLADSKFSEPQKVDMLIGAELFFDILLKSRVKLCVGIPTLINTVFGWIVSGHYIQEEHSRRGMLNSLLVTKSDDDMDCLDETLQAFWKIEEVEPTKMHLTDEQLQCEQFLKDTIVQHNDGRLMVRLPFRRDPNMLGDSFKMAQRRFMNLEKRLSNHEDIKTQYIEFRREYEDLGHMELVPKNEMASIRYIMPHQCVIRPDSSTTKLRVVFDASARTASNVSLNEVLMVGPTVQDDLFAIILRFQSYVFALRINDVDIIKALGIIWEPQSDEFRFIASLDNINCTKITKRSVLSDLSRLFDPLGLVNPVVVLAKIFMQRLWILKLEWDTPVPEDLAIQWRVYRAQLVNLNKAHIHRRIFSSDMNQCDLHGFADASLRAYGCCLYTRCMDANGNVIVRQVEAKSKVAPVATESLPRLELNVAVLLAKLLNRVTTSLKKKFDNIFLWTDSEIVLDWLSDHPSAWEVYIANRVSTIHKLTINSSWRHVNSKANPADVISRGALADELLQSMWFTGPDFLYKSEDCWPKEKVPKLKENVPGKRKVKSVFVSIVNKNESDMVQQHKYINSFQKLRRIFAYCVRFFNNTQLKRKNEQLMSGPLSVRELDNTLLRLVWCIQRRHFKEEINILERRNQQKLDHIDIPKHSCIKSLNPFIDHTSNIQLLKVGGRLKNSDLPDTSKYPILIPKNHPVAFAYINYLHFQNFHAGSQSLVSIARQRFWIVDIKRVARKVVHMCIRCFKAKPRLMEQIMGDLHANRVWPARPFWNCGVDFCGPIYITQRIISRGPVKAYVAVFVCFVTKAVHLEVVSTLSADSFIASLKRFIARRGICRNLYCDNATNFVGAKNEMIEFSKMFQANESKDKIVRWCSEVSVEFHHIPPRSPHFGGLWEAAVKSAKHLLVRTIGSNTLTFEELSTIITQIEAVLNSRPITAMSADPNDESALTPGHFLTGSPLNALAEPDVTHTKLTLLNRWQQVCALQQTFWKRWSEEYVNQLQYRYKWNSSSPDIKVGTLVVIHEDKVPPQNWLLGRIIETIKGKDGHVRVINIRTKNGIIKRSINKVAPLPFEA